MNKLVLLSFAALLAAASATAGEPVEVRVRKTPGGPVIHVDGKPVVPRMFFGCPTWGNPPDEESPFFRTLAHCRDAGVRFVSFAAPLCWQEKETERQWDAIDYLINRMLRFHPDALLIPRVYMNPPKEIIEKHPEWRMQFADGKECNVASIFSKEYRRQAVAQLEKYVRHLREKYPRNFAGVHPTAQSYGEFFYQDCLGGRVHGLEACELEAWRAWLAAHHDENAASATIPSVAERTTHPNGLLRDPLSERNLILFSRFEQDALADCVLEFASAARRASEGRSLTMFFFGYGFEHVHVPNGPASTGIYSLGRLLDRAKGDVDILCGPISYINRKYPATASSQSAADSVLMHDILWLDEDDTRTYRVRKVDEWATAGGWVMIDKDQTMRQLRVNLTGEILRGRACWWMDLLSHGWYDDRDLWKVMEELRPLDERMLSRKGLYSPEIAFILDERGMMFVAAGAAGVLQPLVKFNRDDLERCGVTYGQYLAGDVLAGKVPSKLQIFTSTYFAAESTRRLIAEQRKAQPDVTRVWCWAPGWLTMQGRSEENILKTTGFRVRQIPAAVPKVTATQSGKRLGLPDAWSGPAKTDPLFSAYASGEETLARWPDGSPAVAVRKCGRGYEVFCGIPALPLEVIAAFARLAGCKSLAAPGTAIVNEAEGIVSVQPFADFGRRENFTEK